MSQSSRILIVEDDDGTRELLHLYLDDHGYEILEARDGDEALALADKSPPDLVITDVMLPRMNGFEVARRLKLLYHDVPIIIATALRDQSSKLLCFRVGADEFLSHPIDRIELGLRVANLLSLRARHRALARRNVELAELQRFKDEMSTTVVHDLKNPLSVILANLSWTVGEIDRGELGDLRSALDESLQAGRRMLRLLVNLADVSKSDVGRLELSREPTSLGKLVEALAKQRRVIAQSREIHLVVRAPTDIEAVIDSDMIVRSLENILDNAMRYTRAGGTIAITLAPHAHATHPSAILTVGNDGPAIPEAARHAIFEKFGQAATKKSGRMNLGLGLYFCRLAAEAHGGTLELTSTAEFPTVFELRLPLS